ncbi:MAG: YeeE/YedE family protein [Casimicrobiaceae bacterium]
MHAATALVAGMLFGLGLMISGMADPSKVLGFLDLAGAWDPSLILVMAGAIALSGAGYYAARRRTSSLLGTTMHLPVTRDIDCRLVGGSVLFGVGWGIAGFCPGPGLVALGLGEAKAVVFVGGMLAGMVVFEFLEQRQRAVSTKLQD